jgi:3-oxoacyl-[acyl-carrier protein] reductase
MIWVLELWHFKPEIDDITPVMQEMDDLLGPAAHDDEGWCGHARFFARLDDPGRGMMLYPWRSAELHERLVREEEPRLASFYQTYCTRPREIYRHTELPVDVDGHHDGPEPGGGTATPGGGAGGSAGGGQAVPVGDGGSVR